MHRVIICWSIVSLYELGSFLIASGEEFRLGKSCIFILVSSKFMDSGVTCSESGLDSTGANEGSIVVGRAGTGVFPGTIGCPDNQTKGLLVGGVILAGVFDDCGLKAFFQAPVAGDLLDLLDLLDLDAADEGALSTAGSGMDKVALASISGTRMGRQTVGKFDECRVQNVFSRRLFCLQGCTPQGTTNYWVKYVV